jgi:hypothetical protein
MKTATKNFRIITYGDSFSGLKTRDLRLASGGVPVLKRWGPSSSRPRDTGEFLLVSSNELDDRFAEAFHEYATQATRLLVFRREGGSVDRLLSRLVDLQIRKPERFYVLDADFGPGKAREMTFLYSIVRRLAAALEAHDQQERVLHATVENGILHVVSANLNRLDVPIAEIPVLKNEDTSDLPDIEIDEDGAFIYWPTLDVHLGWTQLQQLIDPVAALKASQKSKVFNERYGKAVQKLRQAAGLSASGVPGLGEKQLGRVERGECRLTSNAIAALSKAHKMEPNEYMRILAEVLE